MKGMTQSEKILEWLNEGKPITALQALDHFGCFRLAARIQDIKKQGVQVCSKRVVTKHGAVIAEYSLAMPKQMSLF